MNILKEIAVGAGLVVGIGAALVAAVFEAQLIFRYLRHWNKLTSKPPSGKISFKAGGVGLEVEEAEAVHETTVVVGRLQEELEDTRASVKGLLFRIRKLEGKALPAPRKKGRQDD